MENQSTGNRKDSLSQSFTLDNRDLGKPCISGESGTLPTVLQGYQQENELLASKTDALIDAINSPKPKFRQLSVQWLKDLYSIIVRHYSYNIDSITHNGFFWQDNEQHVPIDNQVQQTMHEVARICGTYPGYLMEKAADITKTGRWRVFRSFRPGVSLDVNALLQWQEKPEKEILSLFSAILLNCINHQSALVLRKEEIRKAKQVALERRLHDTTLEAIKVRQNQELQDHVERHYVLQLYQQRIQRELDNLQLTKQKLQYQHIQNIILYKDLQEAWEMLLNDEEAATLMSSIRDDDHHDTTANVEKAALCVESLNNHGLILRDLIKYCAQSWEVECIESYKKDFIQEQYTMFRRAIGKLKIPLKPQHAVNTIKIQSSQLAQAIQDAEMVLRKNNIIRMYTLTEVYILEDSEAYAILDHTGNDGQRHNYNTDKALSALTQKLQDKTNNHKSDMMLQKNVQGTIDLLSSAPTKERINLRCLFTEAIRITIILQILLVNTQHQELRQAVRSISKIISKSASMDTLEELTLQSLAKQQDKIPTKYHKDQMWQLFKENEQHYKDILKEQESIDYRKCGCIKLVFRFAKRHLEIICRSVSSLLLKHILMPFLETDCGRDLMEHIVHQAVGYLQQTTLQNLQQATLQVEIQNTKLLLTNFQQQLEHINIDNSSQIDIESISAINADSHNHQQSVT